MSKQFDAAAKKLIDLDPLAWIRFFGKEGRTATVLDSDLNLPMAADRLIRVDDPDYLSHFELHGSRDDEALHRYMTYSVMASFKYKLRVETTVVLLRRQAGSPPFTGRFKYGKTTWEYDVCRLWKMSPEELLAGPVTLAPYVPLSNVKKQHMPDMIREMRKRLGDIPLPEQKTLWGLAYTLMGLIYKKEYADEQLKGVHQMLDLRDSTTYQGILEEGRVEGEARGERKMLLHTAIRRLGPPDERMRAAIEAINSPQELERLADRLYEVETWDDLLR